MKPPPQKYPLRSWLLVGAQLVCLWYILSTASWRAIRIDLQIWELSGVFIAFSGLVGLGRHSFSVFPEPRTKARFVASGIYNFIRHPMYAGVLMIMGTLVWQFYSLDRVICFAILALIFVMKIRIEERQMATRFPEYVDYQKNTNRIIPFVW